MTFHTDFWVVAGTASPVIALSSILVNGDFFQIDLDLTRVTGKAPGDIRFWEWPSEYYAMSFWYLITEAITFLQAATLLFSLMSLALEHNYVSTTLIAATECLSLAVLGLSTLNLLRLKALVKHIEEVHFPPRRSGISSHISRRSHNDPARRTNRYRVAHEVAKARRARMGPPPKNDRLS